MGSNAWSDGWMACELRKSCVSFFDTVRGGNGIELLQHGPLIGVEFRF